HVLAFASVIAAVACEGAGLVLLLKRRSIGQDRAPIIGFIAFHPEAEMPSVRSPVAQGIGITARQLADMFLEQRRSESMLLFQSFQRNRLRRRALTIRRATNVDLEATLAENGHKDAGIIARGFDIHLRQSTLVHVAVAHQRLMEGPKIILAGDHVMMVTEIRKSRWNEGNENQQERSGYQDISTAPPRKPCPSSATNGRCLRTHWHAKRALLCDPSKCSHPQPHRRNRSSATHRQWRQCLPEEVQAPQRQGVATQVVFDLLSAVRIKRLQQIS